MLELRAAVGKRAAFVVLICSGYTVEIAAKILQWQDQGKLSPLVWLYCWNLLVTLTDLVLHFSRRVPLAQPVER